jgi:membrane protease YdiL (CAAX protease family)
MILVLAAMNAFGEEAMYRGGLLAPLIPAVGTRHAILLTAAFFGIGHYYGVPNGIVGVAMSTLLGWFLGKCMVETKGFFWPWFIHFLQDVMIFYFLAVGAVVAGGR